MQDWSVHPTTFDERVEAAVSGRLEVTDCDVRIMDSFPKHRGRSVRLSALLAVCLICLTGGLSLDI